VAEPEFARRNLRSLDRLTSDRLLRVVIDSAIAAVITMDDHGRVTGWGARAETMFGWSTDEACGRSLVDLIVPPEYREDHNAGLARYRQTGEGRVLGTVIEVSALRRDGQEFPVELRISPAARIDGETVFIAFVLDITERRQREDETRRALEDAHAARSAVDGFVSMIVHELRQPLGLANAYADLLLTRGRLTPEDQRGAQAILNASEHGLRLVDDILMAARLSGDGLRPELATLDPVDVVAAALARAEPEITRRGGAISIDAQATAGELVRADATFVGRILDNLVGNAVKYSPGAPSLRISVRAHDSVDIVVVDNGKGVPPDMHERIFDRFVRVEDRGSVAGSGLGLYVSRELASLQGGSLKLLWSEVGRGSAFALQLPRA
jgi:PAS domain S-box-containing protein